MEKTTRTILIVEDEERIAQLIRKLIHFDELGLRCQDTAKNGQEGYDAILKNSPDIVITDIRMPKINGLDLIEMVRRQRPQIRFIVLSGYKEFEYAHRALQYEVDGYLLKPINETELNETLRRIVGTLDAKRQAASEALRMQQEVQESRQIIRRDFLRTIIEQEENGELDELALNGPLPVEMAGDLFRGIDIKLDNPTPEEGNRKEEKQIAERVISIVEKNLDKYTQEILCCEKEALHIYALFNYRSENSREIRSAISEILSQIKEYLLRFEQYEATIGIGMEKTLFSETRISIHEASRAVGNRIGLGCGRLIYAENLKNLSAAANPVPNAAGNLSHHFIFIFWLHCAACGILALQPGIKPLPMAVKVWHPNHWTTREFPTTFKGLEHPWILENSIRRQEYSGCILFLFLTSNSDQPRFFRNHDPNSRGSYGLG